MLQRTAATGGAAVVDALLAHGVDTMFGLPGVQLDPLFDALYGARDRLRVINARHEQGIAYMALGYAQATGRPGVYAAVPGPGFLNTTAALATAYALHAPVLALIGQIASCSIGAGRGELHELPDQTAILRGLTRWAGLAREPAEVAGLMGQAFAHLARGRGPAGIELPADTLARDHRTGAGVERATPGSEPAPDSRTIARATAMLAEARNPMIVVGAGATAAAALLRHLSRVLQAPVVSHLQGRGILPSDDPFSLGRAEAVRLWLDTDMVLAVGTRFNGPRKLWGLRPDQRVIRIDVDPAQFGRGTPPDVAIASDAVPALEALLRSLESRRPERPSRAAEFAALKAEVAETFERELAPQMAWVRSLRAALPDDSVVVADYTQVGYVATATFPVSAPRRLITPGYQGTLGFGFATALGAKVGCPHQPVVALVGDGGFLFTANELATAVQHRIPCVTVLFNDGAYGNVRRIQQENYDGRLIASDLRNPDFFRFAESFGAAARRVSSPEDLERALRWALDRDGPTLIEVPTERMPNPWPLLEPDLSAST